MKVSTKVIAWLKQNHSKSCAFEIKNTKGNTIPKSALKPHQLLALQDASSSRGLVKKISDASMTQQPFDGFQLVNVTAYVIACFSSHGYCLVFNVDDWHGARFDDEALFKISLQA